MITAVFAMIILGAGTARAEISQWICGKTGLTIDMAKPSVVVHFNNGFSQTYQNESMASSYEFLDGTKKPFTSDSSVQVSEREVVFIDRYQSSDGANTIRNVLDLKTGLWHSDQNGRHSEKKCLR